MTTPRVQKIDTRRAQAALRVIRETLEADPGLKIRTAAFLSGKLRAGKVVQR